MNRNSTRRNKMSCHTHSMDRYDSHNVADKLCKRAAELGMTAIALTQHGVASQVESFKKAAKKYGLKFIPGIEAYFRKGEEKSGLKHLILLAKSDKGWKALCTAISATQNEAGLAVMTEDDLWAYFGPGTDGHGEVIATTACVSGIVADELLFNERLDKEIARKLKRSMAEPVPAEELEKAQKAAALAEESFRNANAAYRAAKDLAEKRFGKEERKVRSLTGPEKVNAENALTREKAESEAAKKNLPALKAAADAAKKERQQATGVLDGLKAKQKKYEEIVSLANNKLSEGELMDRAEKAMLNLRDIFGEENFYAEVQYHGIPVEAYVYPRIAQIARKNRIPIVASNDVHIVEPTEEELLRRRMLRSLRYETWSEDNEGDDQLYLKDDADLMSWLRKILPEDVVAEAMANIDAIEDSCNVEFKVTEHYPKYFGTKEESEKLFDELIEEGLKERFPDGLPDGYRARVEAEKTIMKNMGYVDYHLVVRDFMQYAAKHDYIPFEEIPNAPIDPDALDAWIKKRGYTKKVGISCGKGRGSAVGSLVCYALGITGLDPIKYGLYFERFLNPERISMPDIDSDISRTVRPRVIEYVKRKYGSDCVCGIMTQNAQAPKGAVRYAAKCYGLFLNRNNKNDNGSKRFLSLANQIAKEIPDTPGISFDDVINENSGLSLFSTLLLKYGDNADAAEIVKWAKVFEGCFTSYGAHAAGIGITDGTPVSEIVPLRWNDKLGIYTTQCDMVEVEENGMLKIDFLGLKTLDILNDCLWQLHREGVDIDLDAIPLDDMLVYREIFSKGHTNSIFQFESDGMKQMLIKFGPELFENLITLVATFRPGPIQYLNGMIDVKNGRNEMTFLHPKLEPILGSTYGAIVYQEQVMQIFQQLAGYSLGQADLVRRAMSKKKTAVLEKERKAFVYGDPDRKDRNGNPTPIRGCVNNGISAEVANLLFDQMMEFAKYAFNKSHAAAYALLAYLTAFFKVHYPAEFLMAAMNWAEKTQKKDPIPGLMAEAKAMGVEACAPDLNESGTRFATDGKKIFFALSAVKTVGASANEIIDERNKNGKFGSFAEFYRRCGTKKNALENLIFAGAADRFTSNRQALIDALPLYKAALDKVHTKEAYLDTAVKMLPFVDGILVKEALIKKQEELGVSVKLNSVISSQKLKERIDKYAGELELAVKEYESITPADIAEDHELRMSKEHELLGAYVTAHPLDRLPDFPGFDSVEDVNENTTRVYGVITAVDIKKTRKTGNEMAFVTLEDRTGTIRATLFPRCYAMVKQDILEGNIVELEGKTEEDEYLSDETERRYSFIVDSVRPVGKEDHSPCILSVSSYAVFHVYEERAYRRANEDCCGHPFFIYDRLMNEKRQMKYFVRSGAAGVAMM